MSNNTCDAKRHKTKRFSFKRKPFDVSLFRQDLKVKEQPDAGFYSKTKQAKDDNIRNDQNERPEIVLNENFKVVIKIKK